MKIQYRDYDFIIENGGIRVEKKGETLYENTSPLILYIKNPDTQAVRYTGKYESEEYCDNVESTELQVLCYGSVTTSLGSVIDFTDKYEVTDDGIMLKRAAKVVKAGSELGFATSFSLGMTKSQEFDEYRYFAPGFWYDHNQYAPDSVMGKIMDSEYYWFFETQLGLPVFSMYHEASSECISFSRAAADVGMRSEGVCFSENSVDELLSIGSLGMHKCNPGSLNYTYYGYAVRGEFEGNCNVLGDANNCDGRGDGENYDGRLMIDYVYPASEGEVPKPNFYRGLDFKNKSKDFKRTYHPIREGFFQNYGVVIDCFETNNMRNLIKHSWRNNYERLKDKLFEVDNDRFFHDSMAILKKYTNKYGDAYGLPFAAQLPNMDINSVSFQFGFVGQQPGIGYQLLRLGDLEDDAEMYEKGFNILNFWVNHLESECGLPGNCYNPIMKGWEPYPYYLRMIADGVEAILWAYDFLKNKSKSHRADKRTWLDKLVKIADRLCELQNDDGSLYRAYNGDGSVRMDSKSNTPSVIRFLIEMSKVTGNSSYMDSAIRCGEWAYLNAFLKLEYRGGTCDNMDIQDKEAGIYAMWGFIALYEATHEDKWLEAAKGAADYTETWTYVWSFPIRTPYPKHSFNKYSISGQSIITIVGGADVYMAACPYTYYKMYKLTGDEHYKDYAIFINKNTRQSTDVDGSIGYAMPALGHESGRFYDQEFKSNYHWLPWVTFVAVDSLASLYNETGGYEIPL